MLPSDFTVFKYRYNAPKQALKDFIHGRYRPFSSDSEIKDLISQRILINSEVVDPDFCISPGDLVEYTHLREDEQIYSSSISTLFEDEWILGISKPEGLPVTPSGRFYFNSLAILMRERSGNSEISPLHRLDIETSGVLLFCKKKKYRGKFQKLFERKQLEKDYVALVSGTPTTRLIEGDMVALANSKIFTKQVLVPSIHPSSETRINRLVPRGKFTEVWLKPISGKTNQIRVHLASIGCPIVGDKKYHPNEDVYLDWFKHREISRIIQDLLLPRQALHCNSLAFTHPITQEQIQIEDTTNTWKNLLAQLGI